MMFMMPMPPTSSDTAAMPASRAVNVAVVSLSTLRRSAWLRMLKVVGLILAQVMRAAKRGLDLAHRDGKDSPRLDRAPRCR